MAAAQQLGSLVRATRGMIVRLQQDRSIYPILPPLRGPHSSLGKAN